MTKIYSSVEPRVLLHIIHRKNQSKLKRENIIPESEYLQLAYINLHKDQTFLAHKHIKQIRETDIAQESWVVIDGQVKAILYDLDDTIIGEYILNPGDVSITLHGGHNYLCLTDDTLVYEYKTGPYFGIEKDKEFIG